MVAAVQYINKTETTRVRPVQAYCHSTGSKQTSGWSAKVLSSFINRKLNAGVHILYIFYIHEKTKIINEMILTGQ